MEIGKVIYYLRKQRGWSQATLAVKAGMSQQNVAWIEKGKSRETKYIVGIAKAFNIDPRELSECQDITLLLKKIPKDHIPVLASNEIEEWIINGAKNLNMDGEIRKFVKNPVSYQQERKKIFALQVENDSMVSTSPGSLSFTPGTILICEPMKKCNSGNYIIVKKNNESEPSFRKIIKDGDNLFIQPLNSIYQNLFQKLDENCSVLAVVFCRLDILV